jgi:hypothetical protein
MKRTDVPFIFLPVSALPLNSSPTVNPAVILVHITEWETVSGNYGLDRSHWYVYQSKCPTDKADDCTFHQTGFHADGRRPLIYGYKTVWLLGVNHFASALDPNSISISYKVSVVPDVSQTIQDLGQLASAVLGASAGGVLGLGPSAPPNSLVAVAKIKGLKKLPFIVNMSYSMNVVQPGALPDGRVGTAYTGNINPTGGNGSYRFQVVGRTLPTGLSLDPNTGAISGTPSDLLSTRTPFPFTVEVTDTSSPPIKGRIEAVINIDPGRQIAPVSSPTAAIRGHLFSVAVSPVGSISSYSYSVTTGSLPLGLSLDKTSGVISGNPSQSGNYSFTVHMIDTSDASKTADVPVSIQVADPSPVALRAAVLPIQELPAGQLGIPYNTGLTSTIGNLSIDGSLPAGLAFNGTTGAIFGIPTLKGDTYFTVVVTPATGVAGNPTSTRAHLQVLDAPASTPAGTKLAPDLTIYAKQPLETSLPAGQVGLSYGATIQVQESPGSPSAGAKYQCTVEDQALLTALGLTASVNGSNELQLNGAPKAAGRYELIVDIKDQSHSSSKPIRARVKLEIRQSLITVSLGATAASGGGANPQGGQKGQQAGGQQGAGQQGGQGNGTGNAQSNQKQGGQQQNASSATQTQTNAAIQPVDCSSTNVTTPCTFTDNFRSDDKEPIDFGVGVAIPGPYENVYASATATPSLTRHTDFYGFVDFYPAFYWQNRDGWAPHFSVGLPLTSRVFYRPYFGLTESLTTWTKAEKYGFPIRIDFTAGFVYMKQQFPNASGTALTKDRVLKPMFGVEIPLADIVSKITGGKSGSSSTSKGAGTKN